MCWRTLAFTLSAQDLFKVHVLHARKFCRRRTSKRKSVSWSKVASRLRLNACWCTLKACKYIKRNHHGGHEDFLLKCNIGCKKHTADLARIASRFSQALLQEILRPNGHFYPKQDLGISLKTKLQICQFNENGLSICQLKSGHNHWEKNTREVHILWIVP